MSYGATSFGLRPRQISGAHSPDLQWVDWILDLMNSYITQETICFILRPTNPFRSATSILNALQCLLDSNCDTLRAVRKVKEHPGKMWVRQGEHIVPLLPFSLDGVFWHSNQTSSLFDVYVQTAALEIFYPATFKRFRSITGSSITPFFMTEIESTDINTSSDIQTVRTLLQSSPNLLPKIHGQYSRLCLDKELVIV